MSNNSQIINTPIDFHQLMYENFMYSVYKVRVLHLGANRNGTIIPRDTIEKALPSFYNLPLYAIIDKFKNDFDEHFRADRKEGKKIIKDKRNSVDDIRVFGLIPESSKFEFVIDPENGNTYFEAEAIVFKSLLPHISEIFKKRDFDVKVSIEFYVTDSYINDDGYMVVSELYPKAITALGERFLEGIEGSSMTLLRFKKDDTLKKCNAFYNAFNQETKVVLSDTVINNMQDGLSSRNTYKRGGNKKTVALAQKAIEHGFLLEDEVKYMQECYNKLSIEETDDNFITNQQIFAQLCGGADILLVTNSSDAESIKNINEGGQEVENQTQVETTEVVVENAENQTAELDATAVESEALDTNETDENSEPRQEECSQEEVVNNDDNQDDQDDEDDNDADDESTEESTNCDDLAVNSDEDIQSQAGCNCNLEIESLKAAIAEKDAEINALKEECDAHKTELAQYHRKDEVEAGMASIALVKHCFSEQEYNELVIACNTLSAKEFEETLQKKVMDFVINTRQEPKTKDQNKGGLKPNPFYNAAAIKGKDIDNVPYHEKSACKVR